MSQPAPYTPTTDFSQQEANNAAGRSTVNTASLDAEFANVETTLDQALVNIARLQRDDGRLKDLAVEVHTLSPEVLNLMGGFSLRGAWLQNTNYAVKDLVSNATYLYSCKTAHNSGPTFSDTNWLIFGFSGSNDAALAAAQASVSAANAAASAATATSASSTATTQATTATTQAGIATTQAGSASTQAGLANTSAVNAANSASAAAVSAASIGSSITTTSTSTLTNKTIDAATNTLIGVVQKNSNFGAAQLPVGTQAQRPTGAAGLIRFNDDIDKFEGHNGTNWSSVGGGATGGGGDEVFVENGQTVTADYTIPSGRNSHSVGPITINTGITVTVSSGSNWVIS